MSKTSKPIFQFSSFDNRELVDKLSKLVIDLGGEVTSSVNYAPRATHLIVEIIDNTEKLFCFVASGKSILRHDYITDSAAQNRFLDEADYHVSKFFSGSKMAQASSIWSELISKSETQQPFYNWRVACFFDQAAKAEALMRIIKAGGGEALHVSDKTFTYRESFQMTLLISDPLLSESAKRLAFKYNVPCYPFHCITDYLLQGVKSDKPILPLRYYEKIKVMPAHSHSSTNTAKKLVHFPLNPLQQPVSYKTPRYQDMTENHLENFWANDVYLMAMKVLEKDRLVSSTWMTNLLVFLLDIPSKPKAHLKKFATWSCPVDNIYTQTYQEIYVYLHDCILQYPPISNETIRYYNSVFTSLRLSDRLMRGKDKTTNIRGLIDVLYLMCIHDHFLVKSHEIQKANMNSSLHKSLLISDDKLGLVVRLALKDKSMPKTSFLKLIQVMDFSNENYIDLELYERFAAAYVKDVESDDLHKGSVSIEQVLESVLNQIQLNTTNITINNNNNK